MWPEGSAWACGGCWLPADAGWAAGCNVRALGKTSSLGAGLELGKTGPRKLLQAKLIAWAGAGPKERSCLMSWCFLFEFCCLGLRSIGRMGGPKALAAYLSLADHDSLEMSRRQMPVCDRPAECVWR